MIPFRKMNGLGNDFVVVDARSDDVKLSGGRIAALADRRYGICFDQFIVIAPPTAPGDDATMRIINADGGEVEACGNAARCVAAILMEEQGRDQVAIGSAGGPMAARRAGAGRVAVDMGVPRFEAHQIPLSDTGADAMALDVAPFSERFGRAACVNVGNPHAVFFVADMSAVPLAEVGPALEHHALFPERANISFATIVDRGQVNAVVWERGVGPTRACGTAACAIGAVGTRLGLTDGAIDVDLPGGALRIDTAHGRIIMEGPYALDYTGTITADGFTRETAPA